MHTCSLDSLDPGLVPGCNPDYGSHSGLWEPDWFWTMGAGLVPDYGSRTGSGLVKNFQVVFSCIFQIGINFWVPDWDSGLVPG